MYHFESSKSGRKSISYNRKLVGSEKHMSTRRRSDARKNAIHSPCLLSGEPHMLIVIEQRGEICRKNEGSIRRKRVVARCKSTREQLICNKITLLRVLDEKRCCLV